MKIHLETGEHNLISHYGPGSISVNGTAYTENLIITGSQIITNWFDGEISELALSHFAPLLAEKSGENENEEPPEIVLLGTGTNHIFPDMALLAELKAQRIAVEVMNTRAACRTYSVLVGEHRPVAAALLQFD